VAVSVLVLRALGIGDLLTAVPALRALRRAHPGERLVLAAPEGLRELVDLVDAVDELLPTPGLGALTWTGPRPRLAVNLHGRGPESIHDLLGTNPHTLLTHAHPAVPSVPGPSWLADVHEVDRWCRLVEYLDVFDRPPCTTSITERTSTPERFPTPKANPCERPFRTVDRTDLRLPTDQTNLHPPADRTDPRPPTNQTAPPTDQTNSHSPADRTDPRPPADRTDRPTPTDRTDAHPPTNQTNPRPLTNRTTPRPPADETNLRPPADRTDLRLPHPPLPSPAPGAVVLHPGAAFPARRWPPARFARVARDLARAGHQVVITGGGADVALAADIAEAAGLPETAVLAGRTGLAGLAALVADAALVICGDTGVGHLATAYGTPSVLLFGPTPPRLWGPPRTNGRHVVLWAGDVGDPHGSRPDKGLLLLDDSRVLAAAQRMLCHD
jgi:ADP-heptose:LPS heptosyltransferase